LVFHYPIEIRFAEFLSGTEGPSSCSPIVTNSEALIKSLTKQARVGISENDQLLAGRKRTVGKNDKSRIGSIAESRNERGRIQR
jgi:hypothetical protein